MDALWNILGIEEKIEAKIVQEVTTQLLQSQSQPPSSLPDAYWWPLLVSILSHPYVVGVIAISASAFVWNYKGQINYFIESKIFRPGKRTRIIQEILDTERSYVAMLQTLMNEYVEPLIGKYTTEAPAPTSKLSRSASLNMVKIVNVDRETLKAILPHTIEIILKTNEILLQKLQSRANYGVLDSTCIGDIFLEMCPFLKCYTSFVNNFDVSAAQITTLLTKNEKFRNFVNSVASRNPAADISNLLICPVQRLPRYVLLFQELLKATPEDHSDRKNIQMALVKLKEVTALLNQNKHLSENLFKVMRVEKKLKIKHDLTRRWIKEGLLTYQSKEPTSVMCFLFSDCVVLAKKTTFPKDKYKKLMVQIPLLELDSLEPGSDLVAGSPNTFVLKSSKDPNGLVLSASSPQECADWIKAVQGETSKVKREASKRVSGRD